MHGGSGRVSGCHHYWGDWTLNIFGSVVVIIIGVIGL